MKNFLLITMLISSTLINCEYKYKTYKLEDATFSPIKEESSVYNKFDLDEIDWFSESDIERDCPVVTTPPKSPDKDVVAE